MEEKIKISAIIKTKNCEEKLCETLESIRDFDEIIVIDEHSSDDTIEIAKEYKAKIIYADKTNVFETLNQSINEAQNEWIFFLEENEILPQKLIFEIQNYITTPKKNKNCVSFCQKNFYLNKEIKAAYKKNIIRLFKKDFAEFKNNYSFELKTKNCKIHKIKPTSKTKNACILKFDEANITKKIINKLDINKFISKAIIEKKSSVFKKPICDFIYTYIIKGAIFDGKRGFIYATEKFIESFTLGVNILENEAKNDIRQSEK